MSSVAELEVEHEAQGAAVKALKDGGAPKTEIGVAVKKLLAIKQKITALEPTHKFAVKEKKKKVKAAPGEKKLTKKELRMLERAKVRHCATADRGVAAWNIAGSVWCAALSCAGPIIDHTVQPPMRPLLVSIDPPRRRPFFCKPAYCPMASLTRFLTRPHP